VHVDVLICLAKSVALASYKLSSVLYVGTHAECSLANETHVTAELSKFERQSAYNLYPFSFSKIAAKQFCTMSDMHASSQTLHRVKIHYVCIA
jgi:hypothetical protein